MSGHLVAILPDVTVCSMVVAEIEYRVDEPSDRGVVNSS